MSRSLRSLANYEKQLPKVIPAVTDIVCISWNLLSHGIIMEKFLKPRKRQTSCDQDKNPEEPPKKRPSTCSCDQDRDPEESISKTTRLQSEPHWSSKMRSYKDNLSYDPKWKKQYPWIEYKSCFNGMLCSICTSFGKVPIQAKGAWVTRSVCNWVKATSLLAKQDNRDFLFDRFTF